MNRCNNCGKQSHKRPLNRAGRCFHCARSFNKLRREVKGKACPRCDAAVRLDRYGDVTCPCCGFVVLWEDRAAVAKLPKTRVSQRTPFGKVKQTGLIEKTASPETEDSTKAPARVGRGRRGSTRLRPG